MPAISVTGTEDWLGEWTFSLPHGSMTDEPIFWAHLLAKGGHTEVGVLVEQSLVGETLHPQLPQGLPRRTGIRIVAEEWIAQTAQDVERRGPQAPRGEGDGARALRLRLRRRATSTRRSQALGWDPPRFMGTAFQNAWINPTRVEGDRSDGPASTSTTRATRSARTSSTSSKPRYGRRPEYCVPVVNRDLATVLLHAFADAHPLTPARGEGGARAGEDAARRVRRARDPPLVRQVDAPGLDGRRLPRRPAARPRRRTPRTSSTASARTEVT